MSQANVAEDKSPSLVPVSVHNAAKVVCNWLENASKEAVEFDRAAVVSALTALVAMPTSLPERDPFVVVTLNYDGWRNGYFEREYKTRLSDYLLVMAANPKMYYYDVLGKHSEIAVSAREFGVCWAVGDLHANVDVSEEWTFEENNRILHTDAVYEECNNAVVTFLNERGPFDRSVHAVPNVKDFIAVYDAIIAKHPYPVVFTFKNAYTTYEKLSFYNTVERKSPTIRLGFHSAAEAAVFDVRRSHVSVRDDRWAHFDDSGNAITPADRNRVTRALKLASDASRTVDEQRQHTACHGHSTNVTWKPSAQERAWIKRVASDVSPRQDYAQFLEAARRVCGELDEHAAKKSRRK